MKISFAPLSPDAVGYLSRQTGIDFSYAHFQPPNWFCATARSDESHLMGVLACEFRTPFDITFNTAIADRRCLTRRLLKAIFKALFSQAVRVTAEVAVTNKDAIRLMERMSFVYEGYCRRGINGVTDALVFGMLEEDCKFLPGYSGGTTKVMEKPHGWPAEAS